MRQILRSRINEEHPELLQPRNPPPASPSSRRAGSRVLMTRRRGNYRRINISSNVSMVVAVDNTSDDDEDEDTQMEEARAREEERQQQRCLEDQEVEEGMDGMEERMHGRMRMMDNVHAVQAMVRNMADVDDNEGESSESMTSEYARQGQQFRDSMFDALLRRCGTFSGMHGSGRNASGSTSTDEEEERRERQRREMRNPILQGVQEDLKLDTDDEKEDEDKDQGFEDAVDSLYASMSVAPEKKEGLEDIEEMSDSPVEKEDGTSSIPIVRNDNSDAARKRYSSSCTSMSASYTSSGLGTCSSVEEHTDLSREVSREEGGRRGDDLALVPVQINASASTLPNNSSEDATSTLKEETKSNENVSKTVAGQSSDDEEKKPTDTMDCSEADNGTSNKTDNDSEEEMDRDTWDELRCRLNEDHLASSSSDDESDDSDLPIGVRGLGVKEASISSEEEDAEEDKSVLETGYSLYMNEKVNALPIPPSIRQYLMFFRK